MTKPNYNALLRVGLLLFVTGLLWSSHYWQTEAAGDPFDRYPGFGISPEAMMRDDTIAYWEAFNREESISKCMRRSGFSHLADVAFPPEAMQAIAESMGITAEDTVQSASSTYLDPRIRNQDYVKTLSASKKDQYYQALYGESAQAVEEHSHNEISASGAAKDFAIGGCYGSAIESHVSIWDTKRNLADDLHTMRVQIAYTDEANQAQKDFNACTQRVGGMLANHPGQIEEGLESGQIEQTIGLKVLDECTSAWTNGYRLAWNKAAKAFIAQNAETFAQIEAQYTDVMKQVQSDQAFKSYLTRQVVVLSASSTMSKGIDRDKWEYKQDEQPNEIYFPVIFTGQPS